MSEPERYPPPDFSCPPPTFMQQQQQQLQQQPRSSSFHPSMWSWGEAPCEASWGRGVNHSWYHQREAAGPAHHRPRPPFNQDSGGEWYQAGHPGGRQNHRPPHQHRKQRNRKEPEYSHFCDTCDRGFKNQQKYDEHVLQHVKCSVPDCNFMAHEKLVAIHWKNNHAPGAKRIKLDTPEEIAKWREERRKNYPTLQNVEKKKKVMEVREQTGGVLETAQFGRMRGRGRGRGRSRGRGWCNRGFRGQHQQGPLPLNSTAAETPKPMNQGLDPLGALASTDHDSDKEEAAPEHTIGGLVVPPKQMSSALGSLVANYGSTSESDEEPEASPILRARELVQENQAILTGITSEDSGPFKQVEKPSDTRTGPPRISGPDMQNDRRGGGRGSRGRRSRGRPQTCRATLLEMLLAPDIRHERNVLLQCVRYVVRNHFFGVESRTPNREEIKSKTLPAPATDEHERGSEETTAASRPGSAIHHEIHSESPMVLETGDVGGLNGESAGRTDGGSADSIQSVEEKTSNAYNIYDDEIWEMNEAVL